MVRLYVSLLAVTLAAGPALALPNEDERRSNLEAREPGFGGGFMKVIGKGVSHFGHHEHHDHHGRHDHHGATGLISDISNNIPNPNQNQNYRREYLETREPGFGGGFMKVVGKGVSHLGHHEHHEHGKHHDTIGLISDISNNIPNPNQNQNYRREYLETREPGFGGGFIKVVGKGVSHFGHHGAKHIDDFIPSPNNNNNNQNYRRELDSREFADVLERRSHGSHESHAAHFHTGLRVASQAADIYNDFQSRGLEHDEELFGRDLDAEELFGREYDQLDERDIVDDLD
jgi:hypothetical protein